MTKHQQETRQAWKFFLTAIIIGTVFGFGFTLVHSYNRDWYMGPFDITIATFFFTLGFSLVFLVPLIFVIGDIDYRGSLRGDS